MRRPSTRALTCQQLLATTFLTRRLQRQLHLSSLQVHDLRRTHDPRPLQRHWRPPRYHAPVSVQEWRGLPHHTPRLPQVPCEPRVLTTQSPLIRLSRQETQSTQTALQVTQAEVIAGREVLHRAPPRPPLWGLSVHASLRLALALDAAVLSCHPRTRPLRASRTRLPCATLEIHQRRPWEE